jgi:hypothetical protein
MGNTRIPIKSNLADYKLLPLVSSVQSFMAYMDKNQGIALKD